MGLLERMLIERAVTASREKVGPLVDAQWTLAHKASVDGQISAQEAFELIGRYVALFGRMPTVPEIASGRAGWAVQAGSSDA